MNTQVMNHDVHSPIFIRAKSTNDKPQTAKPARSIDWRRIIDFPPKPCVAPHPLPLFRSKKGISILRIFGRINQIVEIPKY